MNQPSYNFRNDIGIQKFFFMMTQREPRIKLQSIYVMRRRVLFLFCHFHKDDQVQEANVRYYCTARPLQSLGSKESAVTWCVKIISLGSVFINFDIRVLICSVDTKALP